MTNRIMRKIRIVKIFVIVLTIALTIILSGCSNALNEVKSETSSDQSVNREAIIIADQFGLAYAPLEIMKEKQFLEKALAEAGLSKIKVEWKKFGNTTAIREAMLSGDLDVGFVGIPPFLIGLDNGMNWKIIAGLSESKVALVSKDQSIQNLEDLTKAHRIILPQPGSIQHILLQMASKKALGNPNAFDEQLIALSHPDGVIAFTSGDEKQLHFTTPPYLQEDLKSEGSKEIIDGITCFGEDFTFIVGICQEKVYADRAVYDAFQVALKQSIAFIEENHLESVAILETVYEYTSDELETFLSEDQMTFSTEVKGLNTFVDFMFETGALKKTYNNEALFWNN